MRLTNEQLQKLMKQENVDRVWSWSRINCFHTSPYEYMLRYIKHVPEDRQDCIYTTTGSIAHDILERLYTNQIEYSSMIDEFEDAWVVAYNISQLKFDRNDEEKNKKIGDKYYENLKYFFTNHTVLKYKPTIEQFVKFKIGDNLFTGYLDCCFKDSENCFNIIDFKTSTIYKGEKAENECGQLVCYSIALNQMGIPFDHIKIAWNFLKYCTVQYTLKNGTTKSKDVERYKLGESLQSNIRMWLKEFGYEGEIDDYLKTVLDTNSIDCLPPEVRSKYNVSDCYVYVPLTQKLIDKWTKEITATIDEIKYRESEYAKTGNEMYFWDSDESVEKNSFYFSTLCGYSANLHLPYKKFLDKLEAKKNGSDLFSGIGTSLGDNTLSNNTAKDKCDIKKDEVDLSWINDIV